MLHKSLLSLALIITLGVAKEDIIVFHAGSLSVPFTQLEKVFEEKYPNYDVKREPTGSIACARKITDLKRPADVVASADYNVIDDLLIPSHAKFNVQFATNEMVIAYTPHSKYADEINEKNWPAIFLREGVKIGHSNPNLDPCGYRAVLVTKLAEKYYKIDHFYEKLLGYGRSYKVGEEKKEKVIIRPKETDLLGLLEANGYDYLFIYKSVAQQHGLKYVSLPQEISLKDNKYASLYKTVSFDIDGEQPGMLTTQVGEPMVYGITVVQNDKSPANKEGAVKFFNFILSKEGQNIMYQNGQGVINPRIITGDASILGKK